MKNEIHNMLEVLRGNDYDHVKDYMIRAIIRRILSA